jgi:hypothetical protein
MSKNQKLRTLVMEDSLWECLNYLSEVIERDELRKCSVSDLIRLFCWQGVKDNVEDAEIKRIKGATDEDRNKE